MRVEMLNVRGRGPGGWIRALFVDGKEAGYFIWRGSDFLLRQFSAGVSVSEIARRANVSPEAIEEMIRWYLLHPDKAQAARGR